MRGPVKDDWNRLRDILQDRSIREVVIYSYGFSDNDWSEPGKYHFVISDANQPNSIGKKGDPISIKHNVKLYAHNDTSITLNINDVTTGGERHFHVYGNTTFTIGSEESTGVLTLDGNLPKSDTVTAYGGGVNVREQSTLSLINGSIIRNSQFPRGGGVYVERGGSLYLGQGASIIDCQASDGGAVFLDGGFRYIFDLAGNLTSLQPMTNGSNFTMTGGLISGNRSIYGAVVYDTRAFKFSGGGVYVNDRSVFSMSGGTISENETVFQANPKNLEFHGGGGVLVDNGIFNMHGGQIIDNIGGLNPPSTNGASHVSYGGGGVQARGARAEFRMLGGIISGNNANAGGGVMVSNHGKFEMSGDSLISGNKASANGGGVFVGYTFSEIANPNIVQEGALNAKFEMTGGTISRNVVTDTDGSGAGVYAASVFTMKGGMIGGETEAHQGCQDPLHKCGNRSHGDGGGVYLKSSATFMMTGGHIWGNSSGRNGGGIYTETFKKEFFAIDNSASFSANTAEGGPYWLDDYTDDFEYFSYRLPSNQSSGLKYSVLQLKQLHNGVSLPNIVVGNSFSSPGTNKSLIHNDNSFTYLTNNYDVNFVGADSHVLLVPTLLSAPVSISYGEGAIPAWNTYFGLKDGIALSGNIPHKRNEDASSVMDLYFEVSNPEEGNWSLSVLFEQPFINNEKVGAIPMAVKRADTNDIFELKEGQSLKVYDSDAFKKDHKNNQAEIITINGKPIGKWEWNKIYYDFLALALLGNQDKQEYQAKLTWTFTNGAP